MVQPGARPPALVVCLHDVWPEAAREVGVVLDAVSPLVGRAGLSVAAIAAFHGRRWSARDTALVGLLHDRAGEVLAHGLTHRREPGLDVLSGLSGWSDELAGRSPADAGARVDAARVALAAVFGREVRGLVAPAWRRGPLTPALLRRHGYAFLVGPWSVTTAQGGRTRVATWSWDWGPVAAARHLAEPLAAAARLCRPGACVVAIHPVDVGRGLLPRIRRTIERALAAGMTPATFGDLVHAAAPAGRSPP